MTTACDVSLAQGRLRGETDGEVRVFRGVPYAAAPVGLRRWRAPGPPPSWTGAREATRFGPDSLQPRFEGWRLWQNPNASEDCLYLNIWAPQAAREAPVAVIVHGGGFQFGGGSSPLNSGEALARSGVVAINFNYRLGILGFAGGSNWLLDQIAALQWVRENVAAFGGAPERVTIMGVSAGGASVNALNVCPRASGLFTQAISVSGGGDSLFASTAHPLIPELAADAPPPVHASAFPNGAGEYAIVDGELIPDMPSAMFRKGRINAQRLMFGFSDYESLIPDAIGLSPDLLAPALALLVEDHDRPPPDVNLGGHALYDHVVFRGPALRLADLASAAGRETYLLDYDHVPARLRGRVPGAPHATALYAALGNLDAAYDELGTEPTESDRAVARCLQARVTAFIKGDAPDAGGIVWPPHKPGAGDALIIDAAGDERIGAPLDLADLARRPRTTGLSSN